MSITTNLKIRKAPTMTRALHIMDGHSIICDIYMDPDNGPRCYMMGGKGFTPDYLKLITEIANNFDNYYELS